MADMQTGALCSNKFNTGAPKPTAHQETEALHVQPPGVVASKATVNIGGRPPNKKGTNTKAIPFHNMKAQQFETTYLKKQSFERQRQLSQVAVHPCVRSASPLWQSLGS
jgi:hypothetical protein